VLLLVEQRDWIAAGRLPLLLRSAGLAVDMYSRRGCVARHSRFVDRRFDAPDGDLPYFDELRRLLELRGHEWCWVLPTTDVDVRGLAVRARDRWAAAILPARVEREVIHALLSKAAMDVLLARAGVPVPRSRALQGPEELLRFAADVGAPVVLKPVDGVAGGGVVLVQDPGELEDVFLRVVAAHPALMVQEYVRGRVGFCQAVFDTGRLVAWMTAWKARTWPGPFGPSSEVRFASVPEAGEIVSRIGDALGFHGLLSFDFIEQADTGRLVVIEVNARPVGVMARCTHAGVDFAGAIRSLLFGVPLEGHVAGTRHAATVSLFPQNLLRSIVEGDMRSLMVALSPAALADVPWTDPGLLSAQLRQTLRKLREA
jgi:predicted ATP-grasp superfamily ATP-dependent carboligase